MDGGLDPRLAADLTKPSGDRLAADLSKEGIKARKRDRKMRAAAAWSKAMKRAFKGIRGSHDRRGYNRRAIERFGLMEDE